MDRLRGISRFDRKNNNNNNGGNNGPDLFGPGGESPALPTIADFIDGSPPPAPLPAPVNLGNILFNTGSAGPAPPPPPPPPPPPDLIF